MHNTVNNISIFGLGAIGSNLIEHLVIQHPEIEYSGIDYDTVENRNIATQAYFLYHVGMPKVSAIYSVLGSKIKQFKYVPYNLKIESSKDIIDNVSNNSLIVDCFDNTQSRKLFLDVSYDCLHIGFSPDYTAEIIWNDQYSVPGELNPDSADICDVTEARGFIHFITSFASMVIGNFLQTGEKSNYIITNKYNIRKL